MKQIKQISFIILTVALIIAGISFSGCTAREHQITSITDVARLAPEGYTMISFADISTISGTPFLASGFGKEMYRSIPVLNQTDPDKLSAMGWYAMPKRSEYEMATVIKGDFDHQMITQSLLDADYSEETYNEFNLFVNTNRNDYVSLQDSIIIAGTEDAVKGTIDVISKSKQNAYATDSNLSALLQTLPSGFLSVAMTGNALSSLDMDGMATDMSLSANNTVLGTVLILVNDEVLLSQLDEDLTTKYDSVLNSMPPVFQDADITISDNMIIFSGIIPENTLFSDETYTSLFS